MKTYEQVKERVELALTKGEYDFCIEFLTPIINSYPSSTKEGVNLRNILITALCGINKREEAKKFCKELLKSKDYKIRENAKYLMEVLDSPEIKKPENWNINFETNPKTSNNSLNSLKQKTHNKKNKKFINISNTPTGETKPFQKGFTIIIFLILLFLIPLLSGCVKIDNTLDLSEQESINNHLNIESKYINKFPWQLKFEDKIKKAFPDAEITVDKSGFSLSNKNLSFNKTKVTLEKILQTAGEISEVSTNLKFNTSEKNFIFFKKINYRLDLDLQSLPNQEDLEISFQIINPTNVKLNSKVNSKTKISKNLIYWNLIPGKLNSIEFSFWSRNNLLIWIILISLILFIAYILKLYRFKIGTDLPQLPS